MKKQASILNIKNLKSAAKYWKKSSPFPNIIVDNFFSKNIALSLEREFPKFTSSVWHKYNNKIEVKKVCNDWNEFPKLTYQVFSYLNSKEFTEILTKLLMKNKVLFSDPGLNGGGWHIHQRGGKLNTHLDYSLHPKLSLQRKINLIVYLNSNWKEEWGGSLGFWGNKSKNKPGSIEKEIPPKFNRAVLFDTTCNSWHGLPDPIRCPRSEYRKSIAVYYLCNPPKKIDGRGKALFAPNKNQINDKEVLDLIKKRSKTKTAHVVYKT